MFVQFSRVRNNAKESLHYMSARNMRTINQIQTDFSLESCNISVSKHAMCKNVGNDIDFFIG